MNKGKGSLRIDPDLMMKKILKIVPKIGSLPDLRTKVLMLALLQLGQLAPSAA